MKKTLIPVMSFLSLGTFAQEDLQGQINQYKS